VAEERTEGARGFLPPDPGGPEPDLGAAPPQPPAPPTQQQPTYAPPQQQLGWNQPPPPAQPGWQQQPQPPQPWAWQPAGPPVPDNGAAVTGFVLSLVAAGLLLISVGLSSIVSVVCSGLGIFYSHRGRQRVDRGETPKHRGLAQAGFITGIVTLGFSLVATLAWALILVLYATDDEFRRDFEDEIDGGGGGFETSVRAGGLAIRCAAAIAGVG
jgi:hypothetical protein